MLGAQQIPDSAGFQACGTISLCPRLPACRFLTGGARYLHLHRAPLSIYRPSPFRRMLYHGDRPRRPPDEAVPFNEN